MMVLLITGLMCPVVAGGIRVESADLIKCADYGQREVELDWLTLYIPSAGDQIGYYASPSTTYLNLRV